MPFGWGRGGENTDRLGIDGLLNDIYPAFSKYANQ
jgi:hypothetical protein